MIGIVDKIIWLNSPYIHHRLKIRFPSRFSIENCGILSSLLILIPALLWIRFETNIVVFTFLSLLTGTSLSGNCNAHEFVFEVAHTKRVCFVCIFVNSVCSRDSKSVFLRWFLLGETYDVFLIYSICLLKVFAALLLFVGCSMLLPQLWLETIRIISSIQHEKKLDKICELHKIPVNSTVFRLALKYRRLTLNFVEIFGTLHKSRTLSIHLIRSAVFLCSVWLINEIKLLLSKCLCNVSLLLWLTFFPNKLVLIRELSEVDAYNFVLVSLSMLFLPVCIRIVGNFYWNIVWHMKLRYIQFLNGQRLNAKR